jgi:hypothetical protein
LKRVIKTSWELKPITEKIKIYKKALRDYPEHFVEHGKMLKVIKKYEGELSGE